MASSAVPQFLSRTDVVQIGSTPVASAAGALLSSLGAKVTVIGRTPRPEQALRTHENSVLRALQVGASSVEFVEDLFTEEVFAAASKAAIVIADLTSVPEVIDESFISDYMALVDEHNKSSWVTISGYGLEGEFRTYRATELTALASGGIPFYIRTAENRPMKPAGYTASLATGHIAAVAGLFGRLQVKEGKGLHLDLSMQESVISTGVFLECAHALFKSPGKSGMGRYAAPRGYFECVDGHFFIVVLEDHQWAGFVEALGRPEWAVEIVTNADRLENSSLIESEIRTWAASRTTEECADLLQAHGVPASALNSCANLLTERDFVDSGFLVSDGSSGLIPSLPAVLVPYSIGDPANTSDSGRNARILDVGNVLAGPLATSWLGTMGIDVLKVEDPSRLDIYRRRGPFIEGGDDIEHGAYFAAANYSKRSCSLDLETQEGVERLKELISESDFVIENLSSTRAERLGLSRSVVESLGATLISSSGFGRASSKQHYRAYGQIIHSYGGITHETRDEEGNFRALGTSWADPLTSVWICALTLAQLLSTDVRAHIDLSMVKVVARQLPEYFATFSSREAGLRSIQNRLDGYAPHGIYRCGGEDNWLAVAVANDDEWYQFVAVVNEPGLRQPEFNTAAGRIDSAAALDRLLDEILANRDVHDLFDELQTRGVPCSPVLGAPVLAKATSLRQRGFIQRVTHPVWGERDVTGVPWRIMGQGPLAVGATPTLGNATGYPDDSE